MTIRPVHMLSEVSVDDTHSHLEPSVWAPGMYRTYIDLGIIDLIICNTQNTKRLFVLR